MYRPPDASAAAILASVFEGVTASHHQLRHLMERLTERQLHLAPTPRPDEPGSGSPVRYGGGGSVGSLLIHAVVFEDDYVNRAIRNQRPMWEQPALADAAGAGELSRYRSCPSKPVAELPPATFRIEPFRCYAEAVFAATFAYVEDIADEELNRRIPGPGRTALTWSMTVSELLIQVAAHAFSHAAEITTLANLRQ
jgi:hypothetical protein